MCSIQSVWFAGSTCGSSSSRIFRRSPDERDVHFDVLVDLGGIDIDVNLLCVRRVGLQRAGHAIVKAHAERQQQVGFLNRLVDPRFAVHAHHAEIQEVRSRQRAESQQRERHGNAGELGEGFHFVLRSGDENPVPGQNQRPLRVPNQLQRLFILCLRGREIGPVSAHLRRGALPIEFACALLRVLGDVDQHRSRTPGFGHVHGFADGVRDFIRASDEIIVLGDGQRDAGDVGFLERVGTEQLAADLPGDAHDGRRVHHGRGNTGHHVGGARTRSRDGDSHLAGGAGITVGHVRGALFVTHQNVANRAVAQRVVRRQDRPARISEDGFHAFALQTLPKNSRAGHCCRFFSGLGAGLLACFAAAHRRLSSVHQK